MICEQCRMEIPTGARVCPHCTRDITYTNVRDFDGLDMIFWLLVIGGILKACEWMGCSVR